jgi:ribonucleoside-diphosphate reductase alpha chain
VIDYIFRELSMSYLGRTDLVQVKPEDLRTDTVGKPGDYPDFDEEEDQGELTANAPGSLENNITRLVTWLGRVRIRFLLMVARRSVRQRMC